MIQTVYHGRFGNNLFQVFLSNIWAKNFNLNMLPYDGQYSHLVDIDYKSDGRILNNCIKVTDENVDKCLDGFRFLLEFQNYGILLDGYFQKSKYFTPYREYIKSWIKYKNPIDFIPEKNSVCIHCRRSDFGWGINGGMLPLLYYTNILETLKFDKLYIFGGSSHNNEQKCIDETVIKTFKKYNPIYPNLDAITEFQMIQKFSKIIASNSTFCWWSEFLSDRAETIYSPKTINGGYRDTDDLDIPNDSRYIYVKTEIEKY